MTDPRHIFLALAIASASITAQADAFTEIVNDIVAGNPALEAQRHRANAAIEEMKAENILADPEVEFERLWRHGDGENRWSAGISQSFDWPGAYSARKQAIAANTLALMAQSESDILDCRIKASQLLIELVAADKEISILADIHAGMEQLQAKYTSAWEHGETTIIDLNKIKIETIRSANRLEAAQSNRRALLAELQSLAGKENGTLMVPDDMEFPYLNMHPLAEYTSAATASPQIKALELSAIASEKESSVAKASRWPGFSVGYRHAFEDGAHFNGLAVGMSLPVYSRKHRVQSAEASSMAAKFDIQAQKSQMESQIQSDYATAESLHKQIGAFAPVVEGVNNLRLLRKALDGGEMSLLSYIQEVNYFIEARLDYITLSKEYAGILSRLNAILDSGAPLN